MPVSFPAFAKTFFIFVKYLPLLCGKMAADAGIAFDTQN